MVWILIIVALLGLIIFLARRRTGPVVQGDRASLRVGGNSSARNGDALSKDHITKREREVNKKGA